jgi:hypothetical protein
VTVEATYAPIACLIPSRYEPVAKRGVRLSVDGRLENGRLIRDLDCRAVDKETRADGGCRVTAIAGGRRLALRLER